MGVGVAVVELFAYRFQIELFVVISQLGQGVESLEIDLSAWHRCKFDALICGDDIEVGRELGEEES